MSKEIWLSPVLGNSRERLLARCAEYIAKGETARLLYIAASHPLLDLVTEKLLDRKTARGVWGEFPVYLFRGFVRRILSSATVSEARPRGPQPGSPAGVEVSGRATANREPSLTRGLLTLPPRVPIDREELPLRRSLISQIIKQLADAGKLDAIKRLANRDGCVNTIASLIGELQRAGKTPDEFQQVMAERLQDIGAPGLDSKFQSPKSQVDFDREVALIYQKYSDALSRFGLTDSDADQLRALQILRGDIEQVGNVIHNHGTVPWLDRVDLLVLDGFFDFTPVQGEMLRQLIPTVPNVIVNVNYDHKNEQIFQPFQQTIDQLKSMADFEVVTNSKSVGGELRERLFNVPQVVNLRPEDKAREEVTQVSNLRYTLLECADRETKFALSPKRSSGWVSKTDSKFGNRTLVRKRAAYAALSCASALRNRFPAISNVELRLSTFPVCVPAQSFFKS